MQWISQETLKEIQLLKSQVVLNLFF